MISHYEDLCRFGVTFYAEITVESSMVRWKFSIVFGSASIMVLGTHFISFHFYLFIHGSPVSYTITAVSYMRPVVAIVYKEIATNQIQVCGKTRRGSGRGLKV